MNFKQSSHEFAYSHNKHIDLNADGKSKSYETIYFLSDC